jgi:hypothetical protein
MTVLEPRHNVSHTFAHSLVLGAQTMTPAIRTQTLADQFSSPRQMTPAGVQQFLERIRNNGTPLMALGIYVALRTLRTGPHDETVRGSLLRLKAVLEDWHSTPDQQTVLSIINVAPHVVRLCMCLPYERDFAEGLVRGALEFADIPGSKINVYNDIDTSVADATCTLARTRFVVRW